MQVTAAHHPRAPVRVQAEGSVTHMSSAVRRLVPIAALLLLAFVLACPAVAAAAAPPGYFGVDFVTETSGWVVGSDSTILYTANGGTAWQTQLSASGGASLLDVCVLAGGKTGWAVGTAGTVLRTVDGKTWTRVFSPALNAGWDYTSVKFVDARTGWICGGVAAGPMQGTPQGAILKSTDGGVTWSAPAAVFAGWCPRKLDAVSATVAVCAGIQRVTAGGGSNAPALVQTADGATWGSAPTLLRPAATQTSEVGDVAMVAGKKAASVFVIGDYYDLLPPTPWAFTGDTGAAAFKYVAAPAAGPRQLRGLCMTSATAGFAVGGGSAAVLKTTNGGAAWSAVAAPLCQNLYAVDFPTSSTGYAVGRTTAGTAATVLKTTKSAASWTTVK